MGERYILQHTGAIDHAYRQRGTVESWQEHVARYAVGNSRLGLALSTAFAAPLLYPTGSESGGFHFRGGSSTGKTTALHVAGSAWGGGGIRGFIRTWRNAPATLAASSSYKLGYRGSKRYVRLALTKAGGTSIAAGAVAVKGNPLTAPVA